MKATPLVDLVCSPQWDRASVGFRQTGQYPRLWTRAPRRLSITAPATPPTAHNTTSVVIPCNMPSAKAITPITREAKNAPANPNTETPPDVPGDTYLVGFVMSLGLPGLSSPSSVAAVSAADADTAPRKVAARVAEGE